MSTTIRPGWAHTSDGLGVEGEFHGHRWTLRVTQDGLPPGQSPREDLGTTTGIWVSRDGGPWHESPAKDVLATNTPQAREDALAVFEVGGREALRWHLHAVCPRSL